MRTTFAALACAVLVLAGCTQEQQNKLGRTVQNWTGTNGVLEVYAGDKLVRRFVRVDKLSTALGTEDDSPRSYRYGYGVLDEKTEADDVVVRASAPQHRPDREEGSWTTWESSARR